MVVNSTDAAAAGVADRRQGTGDAPKVRRTEAGHAQYDTRGAG